MFIAEFVADRVVVWRTVSRSLAMALLAVALLISSHACFADLDRQAKTPIVVMLSLDGFRADYLDLYPDQSPNLRRLASRGLSAAGLIPGFPSSTFPNHYSIVTGMYPGRHGIIGNGFYDRQRNARYRLGDPSSVEDGTWYGGEPLWVAVEKAGMRAASFFWVGSEADVQGIRPSYYRRYDGSVPNRQRVEQVLTWLNLPLGKRPNLVTLYFSTVDSVGHRFGPNSPKLPAAIAAVDKEVGRLVQGLEEINHPVYFMVSSDHGMQQVDLKQTVYLDQHLDLGRWRGNNRLILGGAYGFFYSDDPALLVQTAKELSAIPSLMVLRPDQFSSALRFPAEGPRIPNLVVVVDAPGYIGRVQGQGRPPPKGAHGFLPASTPSMQGIFMASGPRIPGQTQIPALDNVHIYPWVLGLLNIPVGSEVDGRPDVLGRYLTPQNP